MSLLPTLRALRLCVEKLRLLSRPRRLRRMRDIELIQDPVAQMLDEIIDVAGAMIETGTCGQDAGTCTRQPEHILEMDRVVRRLTWDDDKLAAFFEADI